MAILTFIEQKDLSGKTIVPYCTHGTGVRSAQPAVQEWLSGLDL